MISAGFLLLFLSYAFCYSYCFMFYPYKPSFLFVGYRQTVYTHFRRRKMRNLIRVCTVCLHNFLLKFGKRGKKHSAPHKLLMDRPTDEGRHFHSAYPLTPITTKVVCFSRLPKCFRSLFSKQCGSRPDCSYRSRLFWVHAVCFYTLICQLC